MYYREWLSKKYQVVSVKALEKYVIIVGFANGEYRHFDLQSIFEGASFNGKPVFEYFEEDPDLFYKPYVKSISRNVVEWNEDVGVEVTRYDGIKCDENGAILEKKRRKIRQK